MTFRNKQESLDFIGACEIGKRPIHGIEIVKLTTTGAETSMYKTVWFMNQLHVYDQSRAFVIEKMGGPWNYAEFKM